MNILYAALVGLICGGVAGYFYRDRAFQEAQVEILKSDARELPKIEAKADDRKARDAKIVADAIKKLPPTDCFVQPIGLDNVVRLRAGSD